MDWNEILEKVKRVGVTALAVALIALGKKIGIVLTDEQSMLIAGTVISYVLSSTWKAAKKHEAEQAVKKAEVEGKAAAEQVKSLDNSLATVQELLGTRGAQ